MKAIVKGLPRAIPGVSGNEALDKMAKIIKEGMSSFLADLVVTPDYENWCVVLETSTNMLDVPDKIGAFFAGGHIGVEIPEEKFKLICCG